MDAAGHFLSIADWSTERLTEALDLADRLKADPASAGRPPAANTATALSNSLSCLALCASKLQ